MVKNEKNALEKFFLLSQFSKKKKKTKQKERKTKTFLYYYKIDTRFLFEMCYFLTL